MALSLLLRRAVTAAQGATATIANSSLPMRPASGSTADLRAWVDAYRGAGKAQQRSTAGVQLGNLTGKTLSESWWLNTGEAMGWNVWFYADGSAKALQDSHTSGGFFSDMANLGVKLDPTTAEGRRNLGYVALTAAPITIAAAGPALAAAGASSTAGGGATAATSAGELAAIDSAAMAASGSTATLASSGAVAAGGITTSQLAAGAGTALTLARVAGGSSSSPTSAGGLEEIDRAAAAASSAATTRNLALAGAAGLLLLVVLLAARR